MRGSNIYLPVLRGVPLFHVTGKAAKLVNPAPHYAVSAERLDVHSACQMSRPEITISE